MDFAILRSKIANAGMLLLVSAMYCIIIYMMLP